LGNKNNQHDQQADQESKRTPVLRPLLTHLLALLLGTGAVWQYFQLNIQRENQANDIQKQIIAAQEKVLDLMNRMTEAGNGTNDDEYMRTWQFLGQRLKLAQSEYDQWEGKLASLEGRQPKKLDIGIPLTRPTHLMLK
jgi:outer membrane protein TolC